jgi:SAM-dependent methyltransferase
MADSGLRKEAQTGFAAAAAYDAGRPTYLPEVVDLLLQKLEVSGVQGAKILEVAAGTGKFTEVLSRRPEKFDIVAVEPHDDMRQQLSNKKLERVTVVKGTAESLQGIQDGGFAAVIAAQVGHRGIVEEVFPLASHNSCPYNVRIAADGETRFANMKALKELARVLQPTGVLGVIWNIDDCRSTSPPIPD